jgi:hypothetical protein
MLPAAIVADHNRGVDAGSQDFCVVLAVSDVHDFATRGGIRSRVIAQRRAGERM